MLGVVRCCVAADNCCIAAAAGLGGGTVPKEPMEDPWSLWEESTGDPWSLSHAWPLACTQATAALLRVVPEAAVDTADTHLLATAGAVQKRMASPWEQTPWRHGLTRRSRAHRIWGSTRAG